MTGEPDVDLEQWLAANPANAHDARRFLLRYIVETETGERLADLAPIGDEPHVEPHVERHTPDDLRLIADPAARAHAAILRHAWPRPLDRYLEHDPSPAVATAIAEDLLARLAATRTGRDPDIAMRQGWDRRLAPIDADDTRL